MVPLLRHFENTLDLVADHAADLVLLRATLVAFDDVIVGEHASSEPGEEPYFCIHVQHPHYEATTVWIRFTADRITMRDVYPVDLERKGGEMCFDDIGGMTMKGVFDLLRQLPRPPSSFCEE